MVDATPFFYTNTMLRGEWPLLSAHYNIHQVLPLFREPGNKASWQTHFWPEECTLRALKMPLQKFVPENHLVCTAVTTAKT